jgi:hypothetical protein
VVAFPGSPEWTVEFPGPNSISIHCKKLQNSTRMIVMKLKVNAQFDLRLDNKHAIHNGLYLHTRICACAAQVTVPTAGKEKCCCLLQVS